MTIEEEYILIKAAQENPEKFEPIYDRYYLPIFYYIAKRTENQELAGEVTSVVFLKALEKLKQYEFKGAPFSAWLYRIAYNALMDQYRANKLRRVVDFTSKQIEDVAEELDGTIDKALINKVVKVIPQLKQEEITLLELRYFEGRRYKEIADILEISEKNARVKMHRIIAKLKKLLCP